MHRTPVNFKALPSCSALEDCVDQVKVLELEKCAYGAGEDKGAPYPDDRASGVVVAEVAVPCEKHEKRSEERRVGKECPV